MRIEENFRYSKCLYYGLGLGVSLTRSFKRINILLLIAAIATFTAWLAGIFIKSKGQEADFQAHSPKNTSVLSIVFLGREALKKGLHILKKSFNNILKLLYQMIVTVHSEACPFE